MVTIVKRRSFYYGTENMCQHNIYMEEILRNCKKLKYIMLWFKFPKTVLFLFIIIIFDVHTSHPNFILNLKT